MIIDADVHIAPMDLFDNLSHKQFVDAYKEINAPFFVSQIDTYDWSRKNRYHVDRQLLNFYGPSCGLSYCLDDQLAIETMKVYNDFMIQLSRSYENFDVNIWVAMQNPQACIDEINRLDSKSYFGVHVGDHVAWGFMPRYHGLFDLLNRTHIPMYVHFAGHDDAPRSWYENMPTIYHDFKKLWSNPVEDDQKLLILSLIVDILPKYPYLKIVIAEHGIAWIKQFCETIKEHGLADPLPLLKKNFWFTCEPETKTFLEDANFIGWDRLLFATDAPHADIGGENADNDVNTVNEFLLQKKINDNDYLCFTKDNYQRLKQKLFVQ
jgi:predicted TIM-barrel fold metal-dependent hydrolase